MEIIIGRDPNTSRLKLSVGQQAKLFGANGSVPNSVSRQHCSVTINADGTYKVKNLNAQNQTYVNGVQAESKTVTEKDTVELGADHYLLDWSYISELKPTVADIRPLKKVWEQYQADSLEMNVKERKVNAWRSGLGLITMGAIAARFILKTENEGILPYVYGVAIFLGVAFFVKAVLDAAKSPKERQELNDKFQHDYTCPNCGRFLGNQPYDQVKLMNNCPNCRAVFRK